jgi:hypothetical protein
MHQAGRDYAHTARLIAAHSMAIDRVGFFALLFAQIDFGVRGAVQDERWFAISKYLGQLRVVGDIEQRVRQSGGVVAATVQQDR